MDASGNRLAFETMVFGGPLDGTIWRYKTEEQAKAGHQMVCGCCRVADLPFPAWLLSERIFRGGNNFWDRAIRFLSAIDRLPGPVYRTRA